MSSITNVSTVTSQPSFAASNDPIDKEMQKWRDEAKKLPADRQKPYLDELEQVFKDVEASGLHMPKYSAGALALTSVGKLSFEHIQKMSQALFEKHRDFGAAKASVVFKTNALSDRIAGANVTTSAFQAPTRKKLTIADYQDMHRQERMQEKMATARVVATVSDATSAVIQAGAKLAYNMVIAAGCEDLNEEECAATERSAERFMVGTAKFVSDAYHSTSLSKKITSLSESMDRSNERVARNFADVTNVPVEQTRQYVSDTNQFAGEIVTAGALAGVHKTYKAAKGVFKARALGTATAAATASVPASTALVPVEGKVPLVNAASSLKPNAKPVTFERITHIEFQLSSQNVLYAHVEYLGNKGYPVNTVFKTIDRIKGVAASYGTTDLVVSAQFDILKRHPRKLQAVLHKMFPESYIQGGQLLPMNYFKVSLDGFKPKVLPPIPKSSETNISELLSYNARMVQTEKNKVLEIFVKEIASGNSGETFKFFQEIREKAMSSNATKLEVSFKPKAGEPWREGSLRYIEILRRKFPTFRQEKGLCKFEVPLGK